MFNQHAVLLLENNHTVQTFENRKQIENNVTVLQIKHKNTYLAENKQYQEIKKTKFNNDKKQKRQKDNNTRYILIYFSQSGWVFALQMKN